MNIFEHYAPKYYEKGLNIIPVNGKSPLVKNWNRFCDEKMTEQDLDFLCEKHPSSGLGFPNGKANGIFGFDWDCDNEELNRIVADFLPRSPVEKRGQKGYTALFKYNGESSVSFNQAGM